MKLASLSDGFRGHVWLFLLWLGLASILVYPVCLDFVRFAVANDSASACPLIPFLTAYMLFKRKDRIFLNYRWDMPLGALFVFLGILLLACTRYGMAPAQLFSSIQAKVLSLLLLWIGGFTLLFGRDVLRRATFPLLFLLLAVPLPDFVLNTATYWLQVGSAAVAQVGFDIFHTPALREGFIFRLPGLSIEVAKECSGIRSSLALIVLVLMISYLYLSKPWRRGAFVLAALLISVVKNGIRISVLTQLALHVDPSFLYGGLHHDGGILFFLLGMLLMWPIFLLLREKERIPVVHSTL